MNTTITEIKKKIVTAIKEQKGMSVLEYSKTEEATILLTAKAAAHLSTYLAESEKTSVSFPVLQLLWDHLLPGTLIRETKKTITVNTTYTIQGLGPKVKAPKRKKPSNENN